MQRKKIKIELIETNEGQILGVPKKRERVFFIGFRNELNFPKLVLQFDEKPITFGELCDKEHPQMKIGKMYKELFVLRQKGDTSFADICKREQGRNANWNSQIIDTDNIFPTIVSSSHFYTWDNCGIVSDREYCQIGSYPLDYNFKDLEPKYLIGMSVPPIMTAQIAHQIYLQWFKNGKR